jgi:signal transduction histidine kinase
MTRRSLRLRLLLAAALSISLALIVAAIGLILLFDRHVARRVDAELHTHLNQIAAALEFDAAGRPQLSAPLADPRFERPYGELYWQIENGHDLPVRSRSLWDTVLVLPPQEAAAGEASIYTLDGPDNSELRAYERRLTFNRDGSEQALRIVVAIDLKELDEARGDFIADILPGLAILALVLTAAFWMQVNIGLKPLEAMRQAVKAVRAGATKRLDAEMPDEIQPLVAEVNELLSAQEEHVARARARAGDLAHGLKTPLTVLANDAHKLRKLGQGEIAQEIEDLAQRMRRHVDHELARVRVAAHTRRQAGEADLARAVTGIVETLKRSPKGETLAWEMDLAPVGAVAIDAHDLTEIIGNLVDNAVTWAAATIRIEARSYGRHAVIRILDDGPGVPPAALEELGKRGLRLDEQIKGTGIGLAIARELLDAYGGVLTLTNRAEGGLCAEVRLKLA